jgi:phospholipid/cholesterol/gamma-HCH transport system permease protein
MSRVFATTSLQNAWRAIQQVGQLAWRATGCIPWVFQHPAWIAGPIESALVKAMPLALVAGTAIGIVIWIHVRDALVRVAGPGAAMYLPQGLALAVVVELAPLSAGLMAAGRSGASVAAELAAMRVSEQLDALGVLGREPARVLVAPRLVALMLALPLLTGVIALAALVAAGLAESLSGGLTSTRFWEEAWRVIRLRDLIPSLIKTVVFGWLVGLMACYHGIHAGEGTEGVGRAATSGVVGGIVAVLLANVALVKLIQSLLPG